jgi:hypothetical protein
MFLSWGWPDEIISLEHILARDGVGSYEEWLLRIGVVPPGPDEWADLPPLKAAINWGRWIVRCECGGAEYVSPRDPRVYCVSCRNRGTGKWRRVEFPPDPAAVERETLRLPLMFRHWNPDRR